MTEIDEFAAQLLEESKRFLELANECEDSEGIDAYLHASLMLGFCALEAHVSAVSDDFLLRADLSIHEKAILEEKDVKLQHGEFVSVNSLKMVRLEDRIEFLHHRFSGKPIDRQSTWWSDLNSAMSLRNRLTHPKKITEITSADVMNALKSIINTLDQLYKSLYQTGFPTASRGLQSKLDF